MTENAPSGPGRNTLPRKFPVINGICTKLPLHRRLHPTVPEFLAYRIDGAHQPGGRQRTPEAPQVGPFQLAGGIEYGGGRNGGV